MKNIKLVILLCLCLIFFGCARTKITAFKDPEASNYKKLLITCNIENLNERETAEEAFVMALNKVGVGAIQSTKVILPTRDYSSDELRKKYEENNIDAVLFVAAGDVNIREVGTIGNTYGYAKSTSYGYQTGNIYTGRGKGNYFSSTTGTTLHTAEVNMNMSLIDVSKDKVAWKASTVTKGDPIQSVLFKSAARKCAEILNESGLLQTASIK